MLAVDVSDRPQTEHRRVIATAMLVAAAMIAQQIAGKAARDAFFLTEFSVRALPVVMVVSAILSIAVVLLVSRLLSRISPAHAVPGIFLVNAVLFVGEYVLSRQAPRVAAFVVYLHTAALGAAAISAFWSVINERFDPHTAKKAIARIAIGATFGGVVGGLAAWQLAKLVSIPVLFLILACVNVICAAGIAAVGKGSAGPIGTQEGSPSALQVMRETPYLRQLALLVALGAVTESAIDFVFKASAQAEYASAADMVTFFAIFHTATGLITFGLQTAVVERTLRAVGLTGTVAFRPGIMVGGGVLALIFPQLWAATVLRGGAQTIENSFYRSGYEILYTPLSPQKKRPTKTLIDVGFEKLGVALGSGAVLLVVAVSPGHASTILLATGVAVGTLALIVCTRLHTGYVDALAESLRSGVVELDDTQVVDRTTMYTLSQTATALDRDKLLEEIAAIRATKGLPLVMGSVSVVDVKDELVEAIVDLRSGDPSRIRRRLRSREPLASPLVAHVLPLLQRREYLSDAIAALRSVAGAAVGQLVDALLDPQTPPAVRRRLPRVLSAVADQRAVDGLLAALADSAFEVRDWCAVALNTLVTDHDGLHVDEQVVFAAVTAEAAVDARDGRRQLEHIANVLSLVLDRDTIQLAFRALVTDDAGLRGTGLEYLENVVPPPVYAAIRPKFTTAPSRPTRVRPPRQVVDELLTSLDTRGIDIAAVRASIRAQSGS